MDRNKIKFLVDLLMFISFIILSISGFILWLVLPRGSGKIGAGFILLREEWLSIHAWLSVLLIILIFIHLLLNWCWVKVMFKCILVGNPNKSLSK